MAARGERGPERVHVEMDGSQEGRKDYFNVKYAQQVRQKVIVSSGNTNPINSYYV